MCRGELHRQMMSHNRVNRPDEDACGLIRSDGRRRARHVDRLHGAVTLRLFLHVLHQLHRHNSSRSEATLHLSRLGCVLGTASSAPHWACLEAHTCTLQIWRRAITSRCAVLKCAPLHTPGRLATWSLSPCCPAAAPSWGSSPALPRMPARSQQCSSASGIVSVMRRCERQTAGTA